MREYYFHEAVDGGVRATNRLRAVERTTDDGYKITAGKRGDDSISLKLESGAWGRAEDVLSAAERVSLAKLLLSGLARDQILAALPADLLDTLDEADEEDFMEEVDARIFAMLVPADAPEVSFTHTYVTAEGGRVTAQAFGDDQQGSRVWEYSQVFEQSKPGSNDAAMEFLFELRATQPTDEHRPGFKQKAAADD
jgi:hypothetical protein